MSIDYREECFSEERKAASLSVYDIVLQRGDYLCERRLSFSAEGFEEAWVGWHET